MTAATINSMAISIQWRVTECAAVSGYTISYTNTNNTQCFNDSNTVFVNNGSAEGYDIGGLQEDTEYSITVTLSHDNGLNDVDTVVQLTRDACKFSE